MLEGERLRRRAENGGAGGMVDRSENWGVY